MTAYEFVVIAIADELDEDDDRIRLDTKIKDLGGDSLNLVNITVGIEDYYGIKFPKNLSKFQTVEDIVKYVEQNANTIAVKEQNANTIAVKPTEDTK